MAMSSHNPQSPRAACLRRTVTCIAQPSSRLVKQLTTRKVAQRCDERYLMPPAPLGTQALQLTSNSYLHA